ncbi:acyltransferase family protein [Aurantiacibacter hainanensis]|uniref:acyltransferase family protein n=1 Tax=Aurantiacibacter hainanensis TaxID=3076114 RepID=UPI0030C6C533
MSVRYETPQSSRHTTGRLASLDGLRGIAAVVVGLIFHARMIYDPGSDPFARVLPIGWFQVYGWSLVDLFFTLSGFIFAHCYLEGARMRSTVTAGDFLVARIARLWPLHLATLAYVAFVSRGWPETTVENIALSAMFAHVFLENSTDVLNGPAWSLSVEAICYAVFALAAFAGGRWLQGITIAAILAGVISIWVFGVWEALIGRGLAGFFIGVLLCRSLPVLARVPTPALLLGVLLPFVFPPEGRALIATVAVAWPCAILLALRTPALGGRLFTWLGDRSYAIYLVHVPVYLVAKNLIGDANAGSPGLSMLALLACWIAILAIANTLYRILERPAQRAILEFYRQHCKPATPSGSSLRERV